ncbi:hypothetical protein VNI00_014401 [Paramarasmius palmivorus]|uniref:Uncharacterized protein n=1 Tax=Paramarasmius palmivorus TaxID=297713 RepID=A0AAW0BSH1_9AGAR
MYFVGADDSFEDNYNTLVDISPPACNIKQRVGSPPSLKAPVSGPRATTAPPISGGCLMAAAVIMGEVNEHSLMVSDKVSDVDDEATVVAMITASDRHRVLAELH